MLTALWGCIYHASELVSYFSCHGFDFWFIFLCLLPVLRFWVYSLYLCLYFLCYGLKFLLCIFSFNFRVFSSCIASHFALPAFVLFPPLWLSAPTLISLTCVSDFVTLLCNPSAFILPFFLCFGLTHLWCFLDFVWFGLWILLLPLSDLFACVWIDYLILTHACLWLVSYPQ